MFGLIAGALLGAGFGCTALPDSGPPATQEPAPAALQVIPAPAERPETRSVLLRPASEETPIVPGRPTSNLWLNYQPSVHARRVSLVRTAVPVTFPDDERILLQQLREAAFEESDPGLKQRLWLEFEELLRQQITEGR